MLKSDLKGGFLTDFYPIWNLLKIGTVFRNEWDSKLLRGGTL